jgi:hypothetical protein
MMDTFIPEISGGKNSSKKLSGFRLLDDYRSVGSSRGNRGHPYQVTCSLIYRW